MLHVTAITYGDNYNYLAEAPGVLAVVDLANGYALAERLSAEGRRPTHLFLTHHHHDHVAGLDAFLETFEGITVIKPRGENRIKVQALELGPDEETSFGPLKVQALVSSAHTARHGAYLFEGGHCFTGDALFLAGCGRLFEGDGPALKEAMDQFAALAPETKLYFGHEYGLANLRFARSIEADNRAITKAQQRLEKALDQGQPGVPGSIEEELQHNPFLRYNHPLVIAKIDPEGRQSPLERLISLRRMKDRF